MSEFVPSFSHKEIEPKWQAIWEKTRAFEAVDFSEKPPYYCLVEFPYPSGEGMHNGHIRAYMSLEAISRKRRMEGYNVLFPIGFDAFGLPTENYAIKHQLHPRVVTDHNIKVFTSQLKATGFSFDFSRVVDTTDPEYYRFTQWIFLKMYEKGLVYKSKAYVNFCPDCKVVLSNEESQGGVCDRCGSEVQQLEKDVWFLKITAYAKRLLEGLDKLVCPAKIRIEQKNWIGESEGALIRFPIKNTEASLEVFTTRPDTIYGATFMVIAPEHPLLDRYQDQIQNPQAIRDYQEQAKRKTEFERIQLVKEKTGVEVIGLKAINPLTKQPIPIFIADYVMITYGTGAIMAVPGHDERDYEFAKQYDLPIVEVIAGGDLSQAAYTDCENGILVNSPLINGLSVKAAIAKMNDYLETAGIGQKTRQFKMKDWAFNRQRYWGEPIPIIYCEDCGVVPVPYEDLPVTLPMIEKYEPTTTGESPLANVKEFVNCTCPKCHKPAKRETDTMPQWAGSSWYFLRYLDPKNPLQIASKEKQAYWGQVNWYNGGMEHVTRHLIYSRFWNQFLYDIGEVIHEEPYQKRTAQGLILGADGEKMSKSKGNVINPMSIIEESGADTLRMYLLFIGDYEMATPWNENGVKGCRRFLDKIWRAFPKVTQEPGLTPAWENLIHKTIKGVSEDMESLKFNTAIAKLMTLMNEFSLGESIRQGDYEILLKLLNPFSPHLAEELWQMLGHQTTLVTESWPIADLDKLQDDTVEVVININGKVRDKLVVPFNLDPKELQIRALAQKRIQELLKDRVIKKVIVVPNKLVNIVQ